MAGTVNGSGSLRVEVTGTGDHTALAKIMRLVGQAQSSRSRVQALADRAAYWLTLVALGAGVTPVSAWLALGASASYAIERLVTVLVIACPHALGLAIPLVVAISTTLAAVLPAPGPPVSTTRRASWTILHSHGFIRISSSFTAIALSGTRARSLSVIVLRRCVTG